MEEVNNKYDNMFEWKGFKEALYRFDFLEKLSVSSNWNDLYRKYRIYDKYTRREGKLWVTHFSELSQYMKDNLPRLSRLNHPGLEPILDYAQFGTFFYILTPPDSGRNLAEMLGQLFDPRVASYIVNDLAEVLTYLKHQNVFHGDFIPRNIMLGDKVILKNTGMFELIEKGSISWDLSLHRIITPLEVEDKNYFSIDRLYGLETTEQSDQYTLGLISYALLTGNTPFPTTSYSELNKAQLNGDTPDPRQSHPELPEAIVPVMQKAIAKKPQDRFPTVLDFAHAFQHAIFNGK